MRCVPVAIIGLLTGLVLGVKLQNLASVTLQFFSFGLTLPVTLRIVRVYVLGMFTGGSLWSLLRRSYRGALPPRSRAGAADRPPRGPNRARLRWRARTLSAPRVRGGACVTSDATRVRAEAATSSTARSHAARLARDGTCKAMSWRELQRGVADFELGDSPLEVEPRADVAASGGPLGAGVCRAGQCSAAPPAAGAVETVVVMPHDGAVRDPGRAPGRQRIFRLFFRDGIRRRPPAAWCPGGQTPPSGGASIDRRRGALPRRKVREAG